MFEKNRSYTVKHRSLSGRKYCFAFRITQERKIPYYVLRPVFDKSRVSYIPVENHQVKLRELFTREEAEALQGTEEMKKR